MTYHYVSFEMFADDGSAYRYSYQSVSLDPGSESFKDKLMSGLYRLDRDLDVCGYITILRHGESLGHEDPRVGAGQFCLVIRYGDQAIAVHCLPSRIVSKAAGFLLASLVGTLASTTCDRGWRLISSDYMPSDQDAVLTS